MAVLMFECGLCVCVCEIVCVCLCVCVWVHDNQIRVSLVSLHPHLHVCGLNRSQVPTETLAHWCERLDGKKAQIPPSVMLVSPGPVLSKP